MERAAAFFIHGNLDYKTSNIFYSGNTTFSHSHIPFSDWQNRYSFLIKRIQIMGKNNGLGMMKVWVFLEK